MSLRLDNTDSSFFDQSLYYHPPEEQQPSLLVNSSSFIQKPTDFRPKKPPNSDLLIDNTSTKAPPLITNRQNQPNDQLCVPFNALSALEPSWLTGSSSLESVLRTSTNDFSMKTSTTSSFTNNDDFASGLFSFNDLMSPDSSISNTDATPSLNSKNGFSDSTTTLESLDKEVDIESILADPIYNGNSSPSIADPAAEWSTLFPSPVSDSMPLVGTAVSEMFTTSSNATENSVSTKRARSELEESVSPAVSTSSDLSLPPVKKSKAIVDEGNSILPPIVVEDSTDSKALRRARNTAAARRSRDKKRERLSELEARVAELEKKNTELAIENQFLRTLKNMPSRS